MKLFKVMGDKSKEKPEPTIDRKGIMIVDDSRFSRNVLRDILVNEGFDVVGEAKDGLEAVELAAKLKPEFIFLDVEMPKLDGLGAIPQLLSNDPGVNIIMCTALGQKKIIIEATKAGAKDYVIKPYRKENIVDLLNLLKPVEQEDNVILFQTGNKNASLKTDSKKDTKAEIQEEDNQAKTQVEEETKVKAKVEEETKAIAQVEEETKAKAQDEEDTQAKTQVEEELKSNASTKNESVYRPVSEYIQEEVDETSEELTLNQYAGESLIMGSDNGDILPIYNEFEGKTSKLQIEHVDDTEEKLAIQVEKILESDAKIEQAVTIDEEVMNIESDIDESLVDEEVVDEIVVDEAVIDETASDETVVDEAVIDEATSDETVVDEAIIDEATSDETVVDEAIIDEAASDETVVDEVVADEVAQESDSEEEYAVSDVAEDLIQEISLDENIKLGKVDQIKDLLDIICEEIDNNEEIESSQETEELIFDDTEEFISANISLDDQIVDEVAMKDDSADEFSYLWSGRFETNQGELQLARIPVKTRIRTFVNDIGAHSSTLSLLGDNNEQRWIRLGLMKAYLTPGGSKINIDEASPSIRNSFASSQGRVLIENFLVKESEMQELTIEDFISYTTSDNIVFKEMQSNKQHAGGIYSAISDLVSSKAQRRFSAIE
jgi:two-component system chemotaxis response regulator CheY